MFEKLLLAIAFTLGQCAPVPAKTEEPAQFRTPPAPTISFKNILRVTCGNPNDPDSVSLGTAFYVGKGVFVTAYHVVKDKLVCVDDSGVILPVGLVDEKHDAAFFIMPNREAYTTDGISYSCSGFKHDKIYYSIGYAYGSELQMNKLKATKEKSNNEFIVGGIALPNMRLLTGLLIPGMSGGPIVDGDGIAYGINNVTGLFGTKAYSYELKETALCKDS